MSQKSEKDKVEKKVLVRTLPLRWIFNDGDNNKIDRAGICIAKLFNFFRINFHDLQNVELMDIIFNTFWEEQ